MMKKTSYESRFGKKAAFTIGFLFITLGTSTQTETSWLFTLAGMLSLCQGFYDRYQEKQEKPE